MMKPILLSLLCALLPATAALAADAAAPKCMYVEIAKLPLRYVGEGLAPAVDGTIDDLHATMLVDTGAFDTQLTMNGVERRDLGLQMTGRVAEGIGGYSRLYAARVRELSLGDIKSRHSSLLNVIGDAIITPAFDAIVGAPFLLQTDMEMDLHAKQMRFFRSRDCGKTDLVIWKEATVSVPFESTEDRSPNPHFTVTVDGVKLEAIIDTGAHHTTITTRAADRLGIDLKGPRVKRLNDMVGVGTDRAAQWNASFKTFDIGGEVIHNAEIGILDFESQYGVDMLIGQDFLRAHRVLFSMSQRKLYVAYIGGTPFVSTVGLEPWMREEAEGGNPDAQYTLAAMYGNGRGVARDPVLAREWLAKAAAGGEPHAKLLVARREQLAGHAAAAVPMLRSALDGLPADRYGPLWLYTARLRNGEAALAATELQAAVKKQPDGNWPRPIADFYLGKLDAAGLHAAAAKDAKTAHARTCTADTYLAEWYGAHEDKVQADAVMTRMRAQCGAPPAPAAIPVPVPASPPAPASASASAS